MPQIPQITLNSGVSMPQLGFGLFRQTGTAVVARALEAGYRSFDAASVYGNERDVGRALASSGVPRDQLFVTGKVWNADHGRRRTLAAYERSLDDLRLDHLDLYLIHYPAPARDQYVETWLALEELLAAGRVRAIGVANFEPPHLRRIIEAGSTVPAVNQVEVHPFLPQHELREVHRGYGIATEAHTPLARGTVLGAPGLVAVAGRLGRSPAQVALRWHLQSGTIAIPKSADERRMRENLEVLDFELDTGDMSAIDRLADGRRVAPSPAVVN